MMKHYFTTELKLYEAITELMFDFSECIYNIILLNLDTVSTYTFSKYLEWKVLNTVSHWHVAVILRNVFIYL